MIRYDVPHDLSPIMTFHRQWNNVDYVISPFNNPEVVINNWYHKWTTKND